LRRAYVEGRTLHPQAAESEKKHTVDLVCGNGKIGLRRDLELCSGEVNVGIEGGVLGGNGQGENGQTQSR